MKRRVCFPLWLWTSVWALHLLSADNWADALAAALFIGAGFLPSRCDRPALIDGDATP